MENNPELQLAWQFIENTGTHLFLTGKAGTGKTTFLRRLKEHTPKRMVILAPTGIAAINAGGVTIHSFFQLSFAPFVPETTFNSSQTHYRYSKEKRNIIRSMDLLVIDEISMVRADLLDAVDATLRRYRDREKPFGGVQLLMIGDLQQLAPVVKDNEWEFLRKYYETPYFFASHALKETAYMTIELKKVYRQSDTFFLSLLNKIRENKADDEVLNELNRRYQPGFQPQKEEGYIRLTTHNNQAQRVNDCELASLPGKAYHFSAEIEGDFPEYSYPADKLLTIKEGAQIMFLKNDPSSEKRYYNGMIGEVVTVNDAGIIVRGKGNKSEFQLLPEEWGNYKYVLNEETKEITEVIEGTFRQYPIRLAWAITIHKSQGLTFERAIIDASASFAHGQTYVALSRCKTLEGLVLSAPLSARAVISDSAVDTFTEDARRNEPDETRYRRLQQSYFLELLSGLFDFLPLELALKRFVRLLDEHLYKLYPKLLVEYKSETERFHEKVTKVAQKFSLQYTRLVDGAADYATDKSLQERIHLGAEYFKEQLTPLDAIRSSTIVESDNKELKKQLKAVSEELDDLLLLKVDLLEFVIDKGFHVGEYLKQKSVLSIDDAASGKDKGEKRGGNFSGRRKRKDETEDGGSSSARKRAATVEVLSDILHPELYKRLVAWRNAEASRLGLPVYTVIQQKAILGITNLLPEDKTTLLRIPYFGKKGVEKYGDELLEMVRMYKKESGIAETLFND